MVKRYGRCRLLLLITLGIASMPAADERLSLEQLPPAVQRTLHASHYGSSVKEATRRQTDGRAIYEIEVARSNAPNLHLRIAEDGSYVREQPVPLTWTTEEPLALPPEADMYVRVQLSDLPAHVQDTVKANAKGRPIVDIDRETWNGRTVYEVEFEERGLNRRIHVGEDGALVRDTRRGGNLWSRFMGLQLDDVPPPVQETIRRMAGNREIADIDRKGTQAEPVYRVEIKDGDAPQEIRISADGQLLYDSRAAATPRAR